MRKFLSVILTLVLLLSVSAVAAHAEEPVTIRVRSGWVEANLPNWRTKCAEFEAANPGIKVELEFTPSGEDAMAKLKAEFMSDTTPDIVQAWKTYFNEYVDAGLVLDISDIYDANGWKSPKIYGGVRAWCAKLSDARNDEAAVFGIPDFINTSVIFYNTKMFEQYHLQEPTNLEELIAVSKTLNENGVRALA
ncbi:MAG: extracellular solute-binding protein, partial [Clostridia bacterium]